MPKQIIARIRSRWLLARLHQLTRRRRAEETRLARLDGPPSFASTDPAAAHQAHIAAVLDARDGLGGCEYHRVSHAPRLRAMADKIDPPEFDPDEDYLERAYGGTKAAERAAA